MRVSPSSSTLSEINVTPMIDIILVLLIIFMVVTPLTQLGYLVRVPRPATEPMAASHGQIILGYTRDGAISINRETVSREELGERLREIHRRRGQGMVFFAGDPELEYEAALRFLDFAREAGAANVGLLTEELQRR